MEVGSYSKTPSKTIVNCVAYSHGRRKADVDWRCIGAVVCWREQRYVWSGDDEGLSDIRRRGIVGVAGLRCLDGARPHREQGDHIAADGANGRRLR